MFKRPTNCTSALLQSGVVYQTLLLLACFSGLSAFVMSAVLLASPSPNSGAYENNPEGFEAYENDLEVIEPTDLPQERASSSNQATTATCYYDGDKDGFGNLAQPSTCDACPIGYVSNAQDCNDKDATVAPGKAEVCDGKDNDCDGAIDENVKTTYYKDADADLYGAAGSTLAACSKPAGYVTNNTDCYDNNANAKPGQAAYYKVSRGDGSYDYNCDSVETKQTTASAENFDCTSTCKPVGSASGWAGSPPRCGVTDTYMNCGCTPAAGGCDPECTTTTKTQACR